MSFSWAQIIGRTVITNPVTAFKGCWSYPAYKSPITSINVIPVDTVSTPPFFTTTGLFQLYITLPVAVFILLVALLNRGLISFKLPIVSKMILDNSETSNSGT